MGSQRVLTYAAMVPALLLTGLGIVGLVVSPTANDAGYFAIVVLTAAVSLALGFHVNRRLPASWIGPLISANGVVVLILLGDVYRDAAGRRPDLLTTPDATFVAATQADWMLLYLPLAVLLLVFPDGQLPGRRWRLVAWGLPGVVVAVNAAATLAAVSPPVHAPLTGLATALLPVFLVLLIASGASVVVRYRRADPVTRVKLRWIALAGMSVPMTLIICLLSWVLFDGPDLVGIGLLLMYLSVPTAAALALLRADRLDVDSVIVSTASYTVLGAGLLAVLSATSALAGLAASRISTPAAVGVTVLCMLGVPPLHRRLRTRLGRRLYPAQDRALSALDELRAGVHRGQAVPEGVEQVLRQALRDPGLRVGYRPLGGGPVIGLDGLALAVVDRSVPVHLGGEEIGVLVAGPDSPTLPSRKVADAAGFLVDVVRLHDGLRRALAEVDDSRGRLLRAGYEERRRLERDLHDGAQQRLVALGMALRVLQRAHPEHPEVTGALDQAVAEIGTAVAELRQIAHGLRPSSLDDGLGPALAGLIKGSPTPIDLQIVQQGLPDDISTTVYYVASEAVTNAVRYAQAARIGVRIAMEDGQVRVQVSDDGRGGAVIRPGGGLDGLRDRVAALGGQLRIATQEGQGSLIEAVLPCAS